MHNAALRPTTDLGSGHILPLAGASAAHTTSVVGETGHDILQLEEAPRPQQKQLGTTLGHGREPLDREHCCEWALSAQIRSRRSTEVVETQWCR